MVTDFSFCIVITYNVLVRLLSSETQFGNVGFNGPALFPLFLLLFFHFPTYQEIYHRTERNVFNKQKLFFFFLDVLTKK